MKKSIKKMLIVTILTIVCTFNMVGCALFKSEVNELNGEISGNTYNASFYSNDGEKFMDMSGQKINLSSNIVKEYSYSSRAGDMLRRYQVLLLLPLMEMKYKAVVAQ